MRRHFATVCSRITQFSSKCLEKIIVYQSMQISWLNILW